MLKLNLLCLAEQGEVTNWEIVGLTRSALLFAAEAHLSGLGVERGSIVVSIDQIETTEELKGFQKKFPPPREWPIGGLGYNPPANPKWRLSLRWEEREGGDSSDFWVPGQLELFGNKRHNLLWFAAHFMEGRDYVHDLDIKFELL